MRISKKNIFHNVEFSGELTKRIALHPRSEPVSTSPDLISGNLIREGWRADFFLKSLPAGFRKYSGRERSHPKQTDGNAGRECFQFRHSG